MISIHLNHILGLQLEKIRYQKIKTKEAKPKQDKSTQQKLRDDITTHQNVIKPINVHSTSKQVKRLPDPKVKQTISNDTKQNNDEKPKKEENNEQNLVPSNTESRTKPHKPPIKTDQADNESNDDFNKKIVILVSLLLYSIFRTISEFIAMEQSKDEADHKEDRPSKEEEKDDKPCESQYPPKKPEENCKE
ncbi:hypothetical protein [Ornithinibacillus halophilus]|nr:hypothetical protein [Ornithinibacillus halophilus]